jgi:hypothetical protein
MKFLPSPSLPASWTKTATATGSGGAIDVSAHRGSEILLVVTTTTRLRSGATSSAAAAVTTGDAPFEPNVAHRFKVWRDFIGHRAVSTAGDIYVGVAD